MKQDKGLRKKIIKILKITCLKGNEPEIEDRILAEAKAHYEPLIQQAQKAERERIEGLLDVHENELGFCEISNHIPYSSWQALSEGGN